MALNILLQCWPPARHSLPPACHHLCYWHECQSCTTTEVITKHTGNTQWVLALPAAKRLIAWSHQTERDLPAWIQMRITISLARRASWLLCSPGAWLSEGQFTSKLPWISLVNAENYFWSPGKLSLKMNEEPESVWCAAATVLMEANSNSVGIKTGLIYVDLDLSLFLWERVCFCELPAGTNFLCRNSMTSSACALETRPGRGGACPNPSRSGVLHLDAQLDTITGSCVGLCVPQSVQEIERRDRKVVTIPISLGTLMVGWGNLSLQSASLFHGLLVGEGPRGLQIHLHSGH